MVRVDRSPDEGSICIGCGFCCDGTLHGFARIEPDDEAAALALGLSLVEDGPRTIFHMPCPKFDCGKCVVYDQRPNVCRGYRCKLRIDVDEGRMTAVEARDRIAVAKDLIAAVAEFGTNLRTPAERLTLWRELRGGLQQSEGEEKSRQARAILAITALNHYLDRWFRKTKSTEAGQDARGS